MIPFRVESGLVAPLPRNDVDTDQIIPKQFLKRIERTGFGDALFYDWRKDREFFLSAPRYREATILVTGSNFGCGSSREHAAWALAGYGFRAIIAPSFADIFSTNATSNGIVLVTLPQEVVTAVTRRAMSGDGYRLTVDLEGCEVRDENGRLATFTIDPFRRHRLLNGLDDTALTLRYEGEISEYEGRSARLHKHY